MKYERECKVAVLRDFIFSRGMKAKGAKASPKYLRVWRHQLYLRCISTLQIPKYEDHRKLPQWSTIVVIFYDLHTLEFAV